jgi:hypothetical protein
MFEELAVKAHPPHVDEGWGNPQSLLELPTVRRTNCTSRGRVLRFVVFEFRQNSSHYLGDRQRNGSICISATEDVDAK